jgi:hypothetical protein
MVTCLPASREVSCKSGLFDISTSILYLTTVRKPLSLYKVYNGASKLKVNKVKFSP